MPLEIRLILAAFATFRLASLIAVDDGPTDLFFRFRLWAASRGKSLSKLVSCPYCIGVYFAALAAALVGANHWISDAVLLWLGLAGAQAFLQDRGGGRDDGTQRRQVAEASHA